MILVGSNVIEEKNKNVEQSFTRKTASKHIFKTILLSDSSFFQKEYYKTLARTKAIWKTLEMFG